MRFEYIGRDKRKRHLNKMIRCTQNGQNCQKNSLKERVFVHLALKLQYYIVKNTLLQTAFTTILPTGQEPNFSKSQGGGQPTRVLF